MVYKVCVLFLRFMWWFIRFVFSFWGLCSVFKVNVLFLRFIICFKGLCIKFMKFYMSVYCCQFTPCLPLYWQNSSFGGLILIFKTNLANTLQTFFKGAVFIVRVHSLCCVLSLCQRHVGKTNFSIQRHIVEKAYVGQNHNESQHRIDRYICLHNSVQVDIFYINNCSRRWISCGSSFSYEGRIRLTLRGCID